MKKVLVTGATGFIGNYVVEELLRKNYAVVATSSNQSHAAPKAWFSKVKFIPLDLRNIKPGENYFDLFGRPDIMIHLAWENLPNYKESFHRTGNLPRHETFLKGLITRGLKQLTVTGTCLEYGLQEGCLEESMTCYPEISYAQAKHELRKSIEMTASEKKSHFNWLRLFYIYGRGQNAASLLSQLQIAVERGDEYFNMSGGEQVRDFLPVEMAAQYIVAAAVQTQVQGVINCCSGNPVTVKDFVLKYINDNKMNIKMNLGFYPYTDYEPMRFWGSTTKLSLALDALT